MKRFLITTIMAAAVITPALAADNGVSLSVSQPSSYGRLNICDHPQSPVIYRQPRVIENVPMNRPLVYLRVPMLHTKYWSGHYREYSTFGERVLFVRTTACTFRAARNRMVIAGVTVPFPA